jgi:four helix bundle protein
MGIPTKSFEELLVWQKAHRLVLSIYNSTKKFPREELYGLISQIRRSSVSVAANIAEGYRKRTRADKQRFLVMAHGSLEETRYYLILSRDLGYCDITMMMSLLEEVSKLLTLYYRKVTAV